MDALSVSMKLNPEVGAEAAAVEAEVDTMMATEVAVEATAAGKQNMKLE